MMRLVNFGNKISESLDRRFMIFGGEIGKVSGMILVTFFVMRLINYWWDW